MQLALGRPRGWRYVHYRVGAERGAVRDPGELGVAVPLERFGLHSGGARRVDRRLRGGGARVEDHVGVVARYRYLFERNEVCGDDPAASKRVVLGETAVIAGRHADLGQAVDDFDEVAELAAVIDVGQGDERVAGRPTRGIDDVDGQRVLLITRRCDRRARRGNARDATEDRARRAVLLGVGTPLDGQRSSECRPALRGQVAAFTRRGAVGDGEARDVRPGAGGEAHGHRHASRCAVAGQGGDVEKGRVEDRAEVATRRSREDVDVPTRGEGADLARYAVVRAQGRDDVRP